MGRASNDNAAGNVSYWGFVRRNLLFHKASNLLFFAGCAAGAVVLAGALLTGSSLKESLSQLHGARLGDVRWVLASPAGHFRESLADSVGARLNVKAAPILPIVGSAGTVGGASQAHRVNIIGVDERFWELSARRSMPSDSGLLGGEGSVMAAVNGALAKKLGIGTGDEIVLRFHATGVLAMEAPFGLREDPITLRLPVASVASREEFGDFSLKAEHFAPYNVFVPLNLLQSVNSSPYMASAILIGQIADTSITRERVEEAVRGSLDIKDAGLDIKDIDGGFEMYSDRIFIGESLKELIAYAVPSAIPVSSWFVNSINKGESSTPYSFVATPPADYDIEDGHIALSKWAAEDISAAVGDTVRLAYFVPQLFSGLRADTSNFVVSSIIENPPIVVETPPPQTRRVVNAAPPRVRPVANVPPPIKTDTVRWLDRSLMPPYPGLADASGCADWNPSIPVDLDRIRPKDEEYWAAHGGTPKAIISYHDASRIWTNRFGVCTAIRFIDKPDSVISADTTEGIDISDTADNANATKGIDISNNANIGDTNNITNTPNISDIKANVVGAITPHLTLAACGLRLDDIRADADGAMSSGADFAPLFAGLSSFTFAAALLLIWLLSRLQAKSREEERITLSRLGYSRGAILKIYLSEGFIVFSLAAIVGILLAPLYTLAIMGALKTVWSGAAQMPDLNPHIAPVPLLIGGAAAAACAMGAMIIPILFEGRHDRTGVAGLAYRATSWVAKIVYLPIRSVYRLCRKIIVKGLFALRGIVVKWDRAREAVEAWEGKRRRAVFGHRQLVARNLLRDKKRVAGEILILACALFILGITQIFHRAPITDPSVKSSGTGGFILYGELNAGIPQSEADAKFLRGRGVYDANLLSLPMRLKEGDDASCLNLNRASSPAIVGVDQILLDSIGAFSFASLIPAADADNPWLILGTPSGDGNTVYGAADANTIEWGLGKRLGDTLSYVTDFGDTLNVILAAALENSIMQGKIIIAESDFVSHYPSISGYRLLLLSASAYKKEEVAAAFEAFHAESGLALESAADRLNAFNAVENTYLSIFAILGVLGLTLGCLGLGILVARDIVERRHEFAILAVHGFSGKTITRLLFVEHALVAAAGTVVGLTPALIISGAAAGFSALPRIALLLAVILLCGIGSITLGTRRMRKFLILGSSPIKTPKI